MVLQPPTRPSMIRLSGTEGEKLRHGGPSRTFAEHGLTRQDHQFHAARGARPARHTRASRGDRPGAFAHGTCPPRADKAAERSVLRRPQETRLLPRSTGPGVTLRAARPQTRSTSGSPPGFEKHLDHRALRTFHRGPSSIGRTRSPPTSLAGTAREVFVRGVVIDRWPLVASCSSEETTNPPVAPCAHAWNPPARCIMPLHPRRLVKITF